MTGKLFFISLVLVSILYLFLRFNHLGQLVEFRLDQAVHLSESKAMIDDHHPSLLGPMVTSKSFMGRNFFIGANYYYVLAFVGIVASWDPLLVTTIFIFLELVFYLVFTFFLKQKFGIYLALTSYLFLTVSPYLVDHSRFFWNPHLLIPLSIIAIITLEKYIDSNKYIFLAVSAFAWGFAFSSHFAAVLWLPIFIYYLSKSHRLFDIKSWSIISLSFILGDLPFVIFEFRHQFYNLNTMFFVFFQSKSSAETTPHYFIFPLLIFAIFTVTYLFSKINNRTYSIILLIIFYSGLTLLQFFAFNGYQSLDNIPGWDYPTQQKIANQISQNCPTNFNVAATMQGDTRFYDLRFLLEKNNCHPDGVDAYPTSKTLFLVSPHNRLPVDETVWEVTSLKPFTITSTTRINDLLDLHRLDRQ